MSHELSKNSAFNLLLKNKSVAVERSRRFSLFMTHRLHPLLITHHSLLVTLRQSRLESQQLPVTFLLPDWLPRQ